MSTIVNIFFITLSFLMVVINGTQINPKKFVENKVGNKNVEAIASCIVKLCKNHFGYHLSLFILKKDGISENEAVVLNSIIKTLATSDIPLAIINDLNEYTADKNAIIIIYHDVCENIFDLDKKEQRDAIRYLYIIPEFFNEICRSELKKIHGSNYGKADDIIIIAIDKAIVKIIIFHPLKEKNSCKFKEKLQLAVIYSCGTDAKTRHAEFRESSKNFNNCPLKVGVSSMRPYAVITNIQSINPGDILTTNAQGSDIEIMKIIAKYFNATLELIYLERDFENPSNYLQLLLNGTVEIYTGGQYRKYGNLVAYSGIYDMQSTSFIYTVNRPDRSWSNFTNKINGLYPFLIIFILYNIIWKIFSTFDDQSLSIKDVFLYSCGAILSVSILKFSNSIKQRILNTFFLIMCIHLLCYINIQLYSFLTVQSPPILFRTNEEIMASGRKSFISNRSLNTILDNNFQTFAKKAEKCKDYTDCGKTILVKGGVAMTIEAVFPLIQVLSAVNYEATVLKLSQKLITVYHEMLISRSSMHIKTFRNAVQRLFEAGICDKLLSEAVGETTIAKSNSYNKNIMRNSYSCQTGCKITMNQVAGVFYIWLFGCFISFFVFVIETVVRKNSRFSLKCLY